MMLGYHRQLSEILCPILSNPVLSITRIPLLAGPTDKGYRFYVDSLMNVRTIDHDEKDMIDKEFENRVEEKDDC